MSLRDALPVTRCRIQGCPMLGNWPEGGTCPTHSDPFAQPETQEDDRAT